MVERWRRFTLLDAAIIVAVLAVGLALARYGLGAYPVIGIPTGTLLGGIILGPILLLSQRLRGRRGPHSRGEWLWLTSFLSTIAVIALYALLAVFGILSPIGAIWLAIPVALAWFFVALVLSVMAVLRLLLRAFGSDEDEPSPPWTDLAGACVTLLVGPWVVYLLWFAMQ